MLQLYSLQYITVNGRLLTEHFSAQISRSTNSQAVQTVAKGYAGESPGAQMCEVDVSSAIPAADFEFNAQDEMEGLIPVEVGSIVAGKQVVIPGFIISDSIDHAVNSESKYSFKMRGVFAKYQ